VNPDGVVNVESLRRDYDFFAQQSWLEGKRVSVDALVDPSFSRAAVAKIGAFDKAGATKTAG
jgi:NitT/TauT family transport system substrate-binding protein